MNWAMRVRQRVRREYAVARTVNRLSRAGVEGARRPRAEGELPTVRISPDGRVSIGERPVFLSDGVPVRLTTKGAGVIEIGSNVLMNNGSVVHATQRVTIGNHCRIAPYATLCDDDAHEVVPGEPARIAPIVVGDDVWIGHHAYLMPGVTLGRGSVVAAGAVVTTDVSPFTLVGGVPARVLKSWQPTDRLRR